MADQFERELLRGSLDLMVLSVLSNASQYGYMIQQRIDQASEGRVKLAAGTLYPLLHKLEAQKLIRSRWETTTGRRRKWYDLNAKGRKRLETRTKQWNQFAECIGGLLNNGLSAT